MMKLQKCLFSFLIILFIIVIVIQLNKFFEKQVYIDENENEKFFNIKHNDNKQFNKINENERLNEFYKIHDTQYKSNNFKLKKIVFNGNLDGSLKGSPTGGYGNRVYSAITSILIAILLDSQINIRWKHIDKYIETPINNLFTYSNYDDDKQGLNLIEYKLKSYYFYSDSHSYLPKKTLHKINLPYKYYLRYYFDFADPLFMQICTNSIYFNKLLYYNLVSNETIQKALNSSLLKINDIDENDEKQNKLFQIGYEVGGNILNKIWLPNRQIKYEIDFYLNNFFNKSQNYIIGFQLRYGHKNDRLFLNKDIDTLKFINCAIQIENKYLESNKNETFIKQFKWYIASDNEIELNKLIKNYPNKIFKSKGKIGHVGFDTNAYKRAIMDIELLSKCDEIIVTGGSTFGWIAAMKMLKLPFYINGYKNNYNCERAELSNPPISPNNLAPF